VSNRYLEWSLSIFSRHSAPQVDRLGSLPSIDLVDISAVSDDQVISPHELHDFHDRLKQETKLVIVCEEDVKVSNEICLRIHGVNYEEYLVGPDVLAYDSMSLDCTV
jgi:hypothetical protein